MSESYQGRTAGGQTDVAALGSGVVGVAVSILIQPGAFGPIVGIVALTLGLVIVSYIGAHARNILQSLAFASVMGLLAIPLVGMALEPDWSAPDSRVAWPHLALGWIITGVIVFGIDRSNQRRANKGHSLTPSE